MKHSQLVLTALSALFLAACGGGGNNDMVKDDQKQNPPSANQPTPPANTPNTQPPANTKLVKVVGNYIKVDASDNHTTSRFRISIPKSSLDWFFTNGKGYYLRPATQSNDSITTVEHKTAEKNQKIVASNHLSYASYGLVQDNLSNQHYVFAQGSPTSGERVPNSEGAFYHGYAIHGAIDSDEVITGTSRFAIDFRSKKLTGKINVDGQEISLEANLKKDASFSGRNRNGTAVHGNLFGPKAEELAGTYLNTEENFHGAFGAAQRNSGN